MAVLCGMPIIQYSARSAWLSVRLCKLASGVTEGGERGAVAPGRSRQGGAKQLDQKYFMINDHKNEFDIVF